MNKKRASKFWFYLLLILSGKSFSGEFKTGPLIENFGRHSDVKQSFLLPTESEFKVAFDLAEMGQEGKINRRIESLARFLNMHVANGVKKDNIHLAMVVHGKAGFDLTHSEVYQKAFGWKNKNLPLLDELIKNGVQIILCGQSAAYHQITHDDYIMV